MQWLMKLLNRKSTTMINRILLNKIIALPLLAASILVSVDSQAQEANKTTEQQAIKVAQITPTGKNISASRQITIKFNKNIVPLGDMRRNSEQVPVKISPSLNCQWQWLTRNTLACQLGENDALRLATKYTLTIKNAPLNKQGDSLSKAHIHTIETRRPKLSRAHLLEIKKQGRPVHQLSFNQNVSKKSVARSVKYQYKADGKINNIAVNVSYYSPIRKLNDDQNTLEKSTKSSQSWAIQPKQALPKGTAIEIVSLPGLSSEHGNLRSKEAQTALEFESFNDFSFIGISCANTNYKTLNYALSELDRAKCNPQSGITLNFSSPINSHALYQRLGVTRNKEKSDQLDEAWKDSNQWTRVYHHHQKGVHYPVHIPANFLPNETVEIHTLDNLLEKASIKDMLVCTARMRSR